MLQITAIKRTENAIKQTATVKSGLGHYLTFSSTISLFFCNQMRYFIKTPLSSPLKAYSRYRCQTCNPPPKTLIFHKFRRYFHSFQSQAPCSRRRCRAYKRANSRRRRHKPQNLRPERARKRNQEHSSQVTLRAQPVVHHPAVVVAACAVKFPARFGI